MNIDKHELNINTKLKELFPYKYRRKKWQAIFDNFELRVPRLEPPVGIFLLFLLTACVSFSFVFGKHWMIGLPMFLSSVLIIYLCSKFGKSLPAKKLRELTKRIVENDYYGTRVKHGTYNPNELKRLIFGILTGWLPDYKIKTITLNTKIDYVS